MLDAEGSRLTLPSLVYIPFHLFAHSSVGAFTLILISLFTLESKMMEIPFRMKKEYPRKKISVLRLVMQIAKTIRDYILSALIKVSYKS